MPHIVVVGGGPAGSVSALALARQGMRVTLFEAARFPRPRPGESLPPAIEPLLTQLGLGASLAAADFPRTAGVEVDWRGERTRRTAGSDARGVWRNFQADRGKFDQMLLQAGRWAGVDVHEGTALTGLLATNGRVEGVTVAGQELPADWVIDAAGGSHWLARKLGLEVEHHSHAQLVRYGYSRWPDAPTDGAWAEPKLVSDAEGWTWIAPLAEGRLAWVRLRWDGEPEPPAWRPPALDGTLDLGPSRGADVTWRRLAAPAGPGYFCVGDAAFVVDPLSSHGVLRAIMSGMQAAHQIGRTRAGLPAERATQEYTKWIAGWFEHEKANLASLRPAEAPPGKSSQIAVPAVTSFAGERV